MKNRSKLYSQIRPKSIIDVIGQSHLLSSDSIIQKMVEKNYVCSLIFYGPPGIGKTSLAIALCNDLHLKYGVYNSSIDSKDKLLELVNYSRVYGDEYVLIIDEVHRLNKDKQDILLPLIEHQNIKVFLTTTENPFFVINPALRSRCQILELKPISVDEMVKGLSRINNEYLHLKITNDALKRIATSTNGDLRCAINLLDLLVNLYSDKDITNDILDKIILHNYVLGSDDGDDIHNLKSAFHKSVRGSDVNASIYYLHRLIQIGDFEAIYRRLTAMVYEDIGLANPNLAVRLKTAIDSSRFLGMPECILPLTSIVIEMALSPKSNSIAIAINNVKLDIDNGNLFSVPLHIRDSHYKNAIKLGVKGYKYPHDYIGNYVEQEYLPLELLGKVYYEPGLNSTEEKIYKNYKLFIENALKKQGN